MLSRKRSSASPPPSRGPHFSAGAEVEVRCDDEGFIGAWYEATVVEPRPNRTYAVTYTSIVADEDPSRLLSEEVPASHLRPRPPLPPPDAAVRFVPHDLVEAFHNDGWWPGVVSAVPGAGGGEFYRVAFPTTREEVDFEAAAVRFRLRWARGRWSPPEEKVGRISFFKEGAEVEISGDKGNFGVFWLPGIVDKVIGDNIFLVEYHILKEGGGSDLVKELLDVQYIRPIPSFLNETGKLAPLTEVEAFHHGGWVVGVITVVLDDSRYIVKLKCPKEDMEFHQSELRVHQEWISSKWCPVTKGKRRGRPLGTGKKRSFPVSVPSSTNSRGEKAKKRKKGDLEHQAGMRLSPTTPAAEDELHIVNQNIESPVDNLAVSSPSEVPGLQQIILSKELSNKRTELLTSGGDGEALSEQQLKASDNQSSHDSPDFLVRVSKSKSVRRVKKLVARRPEHQDDHDINPKQHTTTEHGNRWKNIDHALHNIERNEPQNSEGIGPFSESELRRDDPGASSEGATGNEEAIINTEAMDCSKVLPSDSYHPKKCTGNGLQPGSTEPVTEFEHRNEEAGVSDQGVSLPECDGNQPQCLQNKVVECDNSRLAADSNENAPDQDFKPKEHGATIPFLKTSFLWEQLESMEVFKLIPQKPHFRQLVKEPVELREGKAIGLMVSFTTLVGNLSKMRISSSDDDFKERLMAISALEENGFNVERLLSQTNELIQIRDNRRRLEEEKTMLKGQLLDRENEKEKLAALTAEVDKDIMELEKQLAGLREKRDVVVDQSNNNETNIVRLRKDVQVLEEGMLCAEKNFITVKDCTWQKETE